MKATRETLEKIAHLARLELNAEDEEAILHDLNKILDWVDTLREIDTSQVEPLSHLSYEADPLREDDVRPALEREKALNLAPDKDEMHFRVPKVIDQ